MKERSEKEKKRRGRDHASQWIWTDGREYLRWRANLHNQSPTIPYQTRLLFYSSCSFFILYCTMNWIFIPFPTFLHPTVWLSSTNKACHRSDERADWKCVYHFLALTRNTGVGFGGPAANKQECHLDKYTKFETSCSPCP